ncbi:MAG: hypothetical protein WCX69_05625 [Candidatus Paceibacterota bacterium]
MDDQNTKENNQIRNSEYKELVDFLGVKFEKLDWKFDNIDKKFDEVNARIDTLANRMARMDDKIDDYHAEQIGMRRDIDRHEKWHFKVAAKVGVDLNH